MSIELSGAMRTNLASLQNTQNLIDETQKRLATGLKVSSALDNPQNFFAAQGLDNRAGDLGRLLDGIGQSVSTLQQANNTIESLTDLINQADSIATSANEALSDDAAEANITGNAKVGGVDALASLTGISGGEVLTFTLTDENGEAVNFTNPTDNQVTLGATDTIDDLVTNINNIRDEDGNAVLSAEIDDDGQLSVTSQAGGSLRLTSTTRESLNALGLGGDDVEEYGDTDSAAAGGRFGVTVSNSATLTSAALYTGSAGNTQVAESSANLTDVLTEPGTANRFAGDGSDKLIIGVNGKAAQEIGNIADLTIQETVDKINSNNELKDSIRASYDEITGQMSITALNGDVESIQIGAKNTTNATVAAETNFGFGIEGGQSASIDASDVNQETESIRFGASAGNVGQLEEDYNEVLDQIDSLIEDAGYRGTNLLGGDDLETTFNEDRSNTLVTQGVNFNSAGLGIEEASFANKQTTEEALEQTRDALNSVREFGTSIANDLTIIETRQEFTQNTIATLEEGADKLTQANTNEEGANLLALQTRQQLGTTALSLASQSQQAVLQIVG